MFTIADQVRQWQKGGLSPVLARVISLAGFSSREPAAAVAYVSGQPLAGSLFAGAAAEDLTALLAEAAGSVDEARVVELRIPDATAVAAGLACGGVAQLLVQPAGEIPDGAWARLAERQPVCLVTEFAQGVPGRTDSYRTSQLPRSSDGEQPLSPVARLFRRGVTETVVLETPEAVVTTLWPTPHVRVVGGGQLADALAANAALLGWRLTVEDRLTGPLTAADCVIVLDHDLDVSGSALSLALSGSAGYVGALGSRRTQGARAGWLAAHGVPVELIASIHGPAGLDIGSRTSPEIAVSILAEIMQVRAGQE